MIAAVKQCKAERILSLRVFRPEGARAFVLLTPESGIPRALDDLQCNLADRNPSSCKDEGLNAEVLKTLQWLAADCFKQLDVTRALAASDIEFGGGAHKGSEAVIAFKEKWLRADIVNYDIQAIVDSTVGADLRSVTATWECLIPGKEGSGVDVVCFDTHGSIASVDYLRYGLGVKKPTKSE
eukprot:TRINITY_DN13613_c0_g1_i2.p1 TRINITY_DN13613_c0_g1~~TRINITY_DN13613_c0_g1_i2.p1  ORF type:complete len:212 (-),score=39.28 TRINITY_DN13613_c0_g1_i2:242-787(-)